jgi:hypothetical protein
MEVALLNPKGFLSPQTRLSNEDNMSLRMVYKETIGLIRNSYRPYLLNRHRGEAEFGIVDRLLLRALQAAARTKLEEGKRANHRAAGGQQTSFNNGSDIKTKEKATLRSFETRIPTLCQNDWYTRSMKELQEARRDGLIYRVILRKKRKELSEADYGSGDKNDDNQTHPLAPCTRNCLFVAYLRSVTNRADPDTDFNDEAQRLLELTLNHIIMFKKTSMNEDRTNQQLSTTDGSKKLGTTPLQHLLAKSSLEELVEHQKWMLSETNLPVSSIEILALADLQQRDIIVYRPTLIQFIPSIYCDTDMGKPVKVHIMFDQQHFVVLDGELYGRRPLGERRSETYAMGVSERCSPLESATLRPLCHTEPRSLHTLLQKVLTSWNIRTRRNSYPSPSISECEKILLTHGIIERIFSFLEYLQLSLVCRRWEVLVEAYGTNRKNISFQSSRILDEPTSSLAQFSGKFKDLGKIKEAMKKCCSKQLQYVDLSNTEMIGEETVEDIFRHFRSHCPNIKSIDMSDCTESDIIRDLSYSVLAMFQEREKRKGSFQTLTPLQLFFLLQTETWDCHEITSEMIHSEIFSSPDNRPRLPMEVLWQISHSLGIATVTYHQTFSPIHQSFEREVTGSPAELVLLLSAGVQNESFHPSDMTKNHLSARGTPLLHCVIALGQAGEDTVNILLHAKGDTEQLHDDGISPIVLSVSKGITGAVASLETHGTNPFDHRRQDGQGLIAYALNRGEEYELRLALQLTSSEQLLSQVDSIREIFKHDPLHRWIHIVL